LRINRIKIERYGPLENLDLKFKPGINVIYGSNESGKSLTMDFLLKKLAKKRIAKDNRINRVQEEPEGFIIFYEKEEIKLEQNQFLTDFLPLVKDEDICKIFVMRDSDFNIPDDEYYTIITDRLTGLQINDITRISEALLNHGCLTPTNREISNQRDFGRLKNKLENAKSLKREIAEYIEITKKDLIHNIEGEIFEAIIKLEQIEFDIIKLKRAKKRDEYLRNCEAIKIIENSKIKSDNLPEKETLEDLRSKFDVYKENETKIVDYIKISNFSKWNILVSLLMCLLFWIVWIITTQSFIGLFTPIVTTLFLLINTIFWFFAFNKKRKHNEIIEDLIDKSNEINLKFDKVDELETILKSKAKEIEENEKGINENIGALKRTLEISDNEKNVVDKAKQLMKEIESTIDHKLKMKFSQEKLEKIEGELIAKGKEIKSLEEQLNDHKLKLASFSRELLKLDINTILNDDFNLVVENLDSLSISIETLDKYISLIENRAEVCKNALEIFDKIEEEERYKINQLFDENSICVNFFKEITDGKYIDIIYDTEKGGIFVKKANNEELSAYKLSEGTFDQLYLAIRVDLAQRILDENKGFLIMDDIFLSYDTKRLKEGIKILKKLSDLEWQIIYFTAKEKECELFTEVTDNEIIKLKPL